jgi:hypothetical protein
LGFHGVDGIGKPDEGVKSEAFLGGKGNVRLVGRAQNKGLKIIRKGSNAMIDSPPY